MIMTEKCNFQVYQKYVFMLLFLQLPGLFSPIQRTLENKVKKELSEHLLGIQVRNAESALFRKTTGQPGMKKQQD